MLRAFRSANNGGQGQSNRSALDYPFQSWLQKHMIPYLEQISRKACTHPIYTIVSVAVLASTTYLALLDTSLFEPPSHSSHAYGQVDFSNLLTGSKTLRVGPETSWKWQNGDNPIDSASHSQNLALMTLVFPDSASGDSHISVPQPASISSARDYNAQLQPSSKNLLSPISQEVTLAYSVPYTSAAAFASAIQELPSTGGKSTSRWITRDGSPGQEEKTWLMSAARGDLLGAQRTFKRRAADAWTAFVDVLKNAEEIDIVIMFLGYLSMHLTFVSLFMSLRRLGSHFWLGTTVLLSSIFAMLFGLIVTIHLGVPLNMVLLSEGLPFLVVTIGFEKPIVLTKAVLSASLDLKKRADQQNGSPNGGNKVYPSLQRAVQIAIRENGYDIVRDYCIEILILVVGAASGVQGGLCQFCFLAAWILFFDCILLFTFYTSILTVKLEINRIKRHVTLRRALEEDGVSQRVAEEVASNDEWPRPHSRDREVYGTSPVRESSIFGMKARDSSISKFKVLMVSGFVLINVLNFFSTPFRNSTRTTGSALASVVSQPTMDPFKVAGNALEKILSQATRNSTPTTVTVLTPIKYELEYPSIHYAVPEDVRNSIFDMDFADQLMDGVGGRMVEGILKSFEDPFLSKWIIAALVLSVILNGYLFNAARWTIKEPAQVANGAAHAQEAARPPPTRTDTALRVPPANGEAIAPTSHAPNGTAVAEDSSRLTLQKIDSAVRSRAECEQMLVNKQGALLTDEELIDLSLRGKLPGYALEKTLKDMTRAVKVRRAVIARTSATKELTSSLEKSKVPFEGYEYEFVHGACCENVIGYLPLPLGVAGPLVIDGKSYFLPMATTEGVLVASTSRGSKAINAGGGVTTVLIADGMTRGPCVGFPSLARAAQAKLWLDSEEGFNTVRDAFNSTSRFARLQTLKTALAGTYLYIRFKTTTGDAMGMNMISKGAEKALSVMSTEAGFDDMNIISLSGNYCTDKKPAAINWIDGRGKSVVAEAIIPKEVVRTVLKSEVSAIVELNTGKILIGSAMAGSIGGFNAHAANIVSAIFLATGQDPAQNVESSQCITVMKEVDGDLQISVSLPCIEVGTIGGGTFLPPQAAVLDMLGVRGAHPTQPGTNARQLARIIAAGVLAGELSLCAALAAGHLVQAHMAHNRSQAPTRSTTPAPPGTQTPVTSALNNIKELTAAKRKTATHLIF